MPIEIRYSAPNEGTRPEPFQSGLGGWLGYIGNDAILIFVLQCAGRTFAGSAPGAPSDGGFVRLTPSKRTLIAAGRMSAKGQ